MARNPSSAAEPDIHEASRLHQKGKIAEAAAIYRAIIAGQPRNFDANHLLGVALLQQGDAQGAEMQLRVALNINPVNAAAHNNYGNVLRALKRPAEALANYDKALSIQPAYPDAFSNRGTALRDLGRHDDAVESFRQALALKPADAPSLQNLGSLLLQLKRPDEALGYFEQLATIRPTAETLVSQGNILADLRRPEEALKCFDRAIALKPDYFGAHLNRGNVLAQLGRMAEAVESYDRVVALKPDYGDAWFNRGNLLSQMQDSAGALESFEKAATLLPANAVVQFSAGNALQAQGRLPEAALRYGKVIEIAPDAADAYYNRGCILLETRDFEGALRDFDKAILHKPAFGDNYLNKSNALVHLKRYDEALQAVEAAEKLQPGSAACLVNKGAILQEKKLLQQAVDAFASALAIDPQQSDAHMNMAKIYLEMRQPADAVESLKKAYAINPQREFLASMLLQTRMMLSDWEGFAAAAAHLRAGVKEGKHVAAPFEFLALPSTAEEQLLCAQNYCRRQYPPLAPLWRGEKYKHDKIRLAYISADFHNHATAYLLAGVIEQHDRKKFHLTAISFSPSYKSAMQDRLRAAFDDFIDVSGMGNDQIAQMLRHNEIDIAIDLKGLTQNARVSVFSSRCAPVQVNYLGFPGTMGAPYMDYIIADRTVIPEEHRKHYAEKVIYLPDSYQPNDRKRKIADTTPTRSAHGLPAHGFVFCSFNNNYKITPDVFDIWMRLLKAVPESVLWQLEVNKGAAANLRREAQARGIDPSRLVFAPQMDLPDHLARHRHADLFLDTLPCNAHTTASDALWAGLPVLTCLGETFAGRVAASLLHAAGLPELVTGSLAEYEALALKLARDPAALAALKDKLAKNRDTCALFDTEKYARDLEKAYLGMVKAL